MFTPFSKHQQTVQIEDNQYFPREILILPEGKMVKCIVRWLFINEIKFHFVKKKTVFPRK